MTVETMNQQMEDAAAERETLLDMIRLSAAQKQALADKYNKLPKLQKREVRVSAPSFDDEVEMYAVYLISKVANDFLYAQARERWVGDLEIYIPRLMTKDANLQKSTDSHVAKIALEIEDADTRLEVQRICKKNLLVNSTDAFTMLQCFERLEELFISAWKR
jgi:hypothetical protein